MIEYYRTHPERFDRRDEGKRRVAAERAAHGEKRAEEQGNRESPSARRLESLQILQTLVKQRRESIDQFTKGGRKDLADKEAKEIAIIEEYLPSAPSDEEIHSAVEEAISDEAGADSLKQMGAVIKAARAKLEGKAVDGKVLSDRVRDRLSGKS